MGIRSNNVLDQINGKSLSLDDNLNLKDREKRCSPHALLCWTWTTATCSSTSLSTPEKLKLNKKSWSKRSTQGTPWLERTHAITVSIQASSEYAWLNSAPILTTNRYDHDNQELRYRNNISVKYGQATPSCAPSLWYLMVSCILLHSCKRVLATVLTTFSSIPDALSPQSAIHPE